MKDKGLVHIYTGDGKGKTTACAGAALRAAGNNLNVYFVQFQKGEDSGEILLLRNIENIDVLRACNTKTFYYYMNNNEKELYANEHKQAFANVITKIQENPAKYDMLVLDELLGLVNLGILSERDILDFLKNKPSHLEVLISGRGVGEQLKNAADYVTEMKCIKHPYEKGVNARKGIEY